jgi:hypothetical protein
MTDLTITRNSELGVAEIQGETEQGSEYVGTILVRDMTVLDADCVIVPQHVAENVQAEARKLGLTYEIQGD